MTELNEEQPIKVSYTHSPAYLKAQVKYRLKNGDKLKATQKKYYDTNKISINNRNRANYLKQKPILKALREQKKMIARAEIIRIQRIKVRDIIKNLYDDFDNAESESDLFDCLKVIYVK
jgi:hypothetical protein